MEDEDSLESLIEFHTNFIRDTIKERGSFISQVIFKKGKTVYPCIVLGGREEIKATMNFACLHNPEWIVIIHEGYSLVTKREDVLKIRHGDLEKAFKEGDKRIKESIMLTVYTKEKNKTITFEKKDRKIIKKYEIENACGYLTLSNKTPEQAIEELERLKNLPFIIGGKCTNNGKYICNLGYACDGCPYNAG